MIDPVCRHPTYKLALKTFIGPDKEAALMAANINHASTWYKIYCDGLGFEGGACALVILYKGNHAVKSLHCHLGPLTTHMVYESKLIGLLLALHLLLGLTCQLLNTVIMGLDNQAMICSLSNQTPKPAHYILNTIHTTAEKLHQCQDHLQYKDTFRQPRQQCQQLPAKSKNVINLQIHWVPGHLDFAPNDKADELAKEAAARNSSPPNTLPSFLRKLLPMSLSVLWQELKLQTQHCWTRHWKSSPHYWHLGGIDTVPSKNWMKLINPLSHKQASIIMQLRTGHIGLNKHLHHIKCSNTLYCPNCDENTIEDTHHFLFTCSGYRHKCSILHRKLRRHSHDLSYLLPNPAATLPLLQYIHSTGWLKQTFGAVCSNNQLAADPT